MNSPAQPSQRSEIDQNPNILKTEILRLPRDPEIVLTRTRRFAASLAQGLERGDPIALSAFNHLIGGQLPASEIEFAGVIGKLIHHCQYGDTFDVALGRFPDDFTAGFAEGVQQAIDKDDPDRALIDFFRNFGRVKGK